MLLRSTADKLVMVPIDVYIDEARLWVPGFTSNSDGTGFSHGDLTRFVQCLWPDLASEEILDHVWFGVYVRDRRGVYVLNPTDGWPEWAVIIPDGNKSDSRIILRDWTDIAFRSKFNLDIILEGECNTPERVAALKEFGFEEITDEEPVLPPSGDPTSSV